VFDRATSEVVVAYRYDWKGKSGQLKTNW